MSGIVFSSRDLRVRRVAGGGGGDVCVVSFSSFTDDPSLDRPGFGENFLRERGIDAIHVINGANVWYQNEDMPAALRDIRASTRPYSRVLTYGSSMGGYAAIRFAEAVGAQTAIAISPQYSGSPSEAPFDRRWKSIASRVRFLHEDAFPPSDRVRTIVFYDPRDADARHFELIAAACSRAVGVRLRHAGHPAGAFLAETGLLSEAIEGAVRGSFDPALVERAARARRRESGQYWFTLARRLPPWHAAAKRSCAAAATAASRDAAYHAYLSLLLEQAGDLPAAERHLETALAILPGHPLPLRARCAFLFRRSRYAEAVAPAETLVAIDPAEGEYRRLLRAALFGLRDYRTLSERLRERAVSGTRPLGARILGSVMSLLARARLDLPILAAARRSALSHTHRKIHIEKELDRVDEWRHRRKRRRFGLSWRLFRPSPRKIPPHATGGLG